MLTTVWRMRKRPDLIGTRGVASGTGFIMVSSGGELVVLGGTLSGEVGEIRTLEIEFISSLVLNTCTPGEQ